MVLYKRKQVQIVTPKEIPQDLNTEVYFIPQTKEWFINYEDYLQRMDYYLEQKFVCEITGNSCLTFFEALKSEIKEIKDVENNFPEALKVHILRFIQFSKISRLDMLVDHVYLKFKNNYFPGESVLLKGIENEIPLGELQTIKQRGVVREKVEMADKETQYLVVRETDGRQGIITSDKISRDRNYFTKYLVKTFIKLTMTRSNKLGAPWVLKDKYATKYNISQEYPPDLKQFKASTNTTNESDPTSIRHFLTNEPILSVKEEPLPVPQNSQPFNYNVIPSMPTFNQNLMPVKNNLQLPVPLQLSMNNEGVYNPLPMERIQDIYRTTPVYSEGEAYSIERISTPEKIAYHRNQKKLNPHYLPFPLRKRANYPEESVDADKPSASTVLSSAGISYAKRNMDSDLNIKFDLQTSRPIGKKLKLPDNALKMNKKLLALVQKRMEDEPKEIKEEIEAVSVASMSSDSEDEPSSDKPEIEDSVSEIDESLVTEELLEIDKDTLIPQHLINVGEALECWIFINIYHNVLKIDTFTFDDFLYAMGWNSSQYDEYGRCELLDEIWCSLLGAMVSNEIPKNSESKNGDIYGLQIKIPSKVSYLNPKLEDELVDGSDSEDEGIKTLPSDDDSESEHETKPKVNGKKSPEVEDEGEEADDEEAEEDEKEDEEDRDHNAYQIMDHRGVPWHDRLRKRNFRDGNWQTILLGILSLIEHLDEFKPVVEKVYKLLAPLNEPATATTALNQFYSKIDISLRFSILVILCRLLGTSDMIRDYIDLGINESSKLRKDRLEVMKLERLEAEKAQQIHDSIIKILFTALQIQPDAEEYMRKKMKLNFLSSQHISEDERQISQTNDELKDYLVKREESLVEYNKHKLNRREIEKKLAEFDCQRLRCLGKDRLYNRYWWFENNGVPTVHGNTDEDEDEDHHESTDSDDEPLEETYLMGKLWIQGPAIEDIQQNLKCEEFKDYANDSVVKGIFKIPSMEFPRINQLDFSSFPKEFNTFVKEKFQLDFKNSEVTKVIDGQEITIINKYGELMSDELVSKLSPIERKFVEECPDPLLNGSNWRYFDQKEDIEAIIRWLNPYGTRESQLKKSLIATKDAIINSIESRNKTLANKERILESEKITQRIQQIDEKINTTQSMEVDEDEEDEDDDVVEIKNGRKRNLRNKNSSNKRSNNKKNYEETLSYGDHEELIELKSDLQEKLLEISKPLEFIRVSEWVNSQATNEFGKSLYDGGDKLKDKKRRL